MKTYKIYQLDTTNENSRMMLFMSYEWVQKHFTLSLDSYKKVYKGETDGDLDDIYHQFNVNHPADFKGHSLSTSDIVELDGRFFYCDSFGWEEVEF